jgi:aldose 1-epimerase
VNPPSGRQTRIVHAGQSLTVVEVGGGIREYLAGGRTILDGFAESEASEGGRGQLLVPWPNRLAGGRYTWVGRNYQLPITEPEQLNAIHGLVRWANWSVSATGEGEAVARHRLYPQPGWEWILDLDVSYHLSEEGLEVVTSARNVAADRAGACPIAFGWHPYLHAFGAMVDDTVLTAPASLVYQSDTRGLPIRRDDVAGTECDFRGGRRVGAAVLDTAFTGLERDREGRATVHLHPADRSTEGVDLWVGPEYTHLMLFSGDTLSAVDRRRRGLAVEPMTAAPDAFNNGDGLRALEPGETLTARWGINPLPRSP